MTLQALLFHKENAKITEEDIFKALKQENYTRGLLRKALQKMIKEPNCSWVEIGKGKPAVDDQLAQLELFFHEDEHKAFSDMLELLTVDTRAVKDINVADKNQLLVKIGELTPGSDGYTVDGEILPKKDLSGEEPIKVGPGVYFSDNKKEIYAGQAGHILWKKEERLIDVEPIYVVEGDVDFSGGNIIGFVGKVIIKGDVKPKFTVTAESDIEVHGSVENAIVESEKGNVTVKGTVIHQQEGHILAKGTVQAGIAANAVIRATSIIIEKEVMNSTLEAEKDIIITGNPGVVVGGTLSAKELIRINTLGSQNWVATKVHVGDITELKRQLRVTHQSVLQNKSKLRESQQIAAILQKKKDAEGLDEGQEKELEQIRTDIPFFEEEIEYLEAEELNYKKEIEERAEARLEIVKTIYPGTDFHVYDGFFMPNEEENAIGYKCRDGLIIKYPV